MPGKKTAADLEKRVSTLTMLVVVQLVLLLVLLGFELFDVEFGESDSHQMADNQAIEEPVEMDDAAMMTNDAEPDVSASEGELPPEVDEETPVRVEILNGCGVSGLAGQYARVLRDIGYDVRDTRNAPHHNYTESWIVDRMTMPGVARRLAATLGIPEERITEEANPQLVDVDVSLILGKDHESLNLQP